jgi:hypothetical protein
LITEVLAFTKSIPSASGRVYGEAMSAGPDWSLGLLAQGHAQSSIKIDQPHKTIFPLIPKTSVKALPTFQRFKSYVKLYMSHDAE